MKKTQIPSSNEIVKTIDCCERWLNYEEKKLACNISYLCLSRDATKLVEICRVIIFH